MKLRFIKHTAITVWREVKELTRINHHDRPWHLPFAAALASGLPLFVALYFGHLEYGLIASLGGMGFLYMPPTRMIVRMVLLLCVTTVMTASFFVGLVVHHSPTLLVTAITVLTILVTMLCRYFKIAPPGSTFCLMAAMIAAFVPHEPADIPMLVGVMFLGGLGACIIGFVYSLFVLWRGMEIKRLPEPVRDLKLVVVDALIIGVMVGLSLQAAQALGMQRPYWVPVACVAVTQGITFRAVWNKLAHRVLGTGAGLGLAWLMLSLHPHGWVVCLLIMCLNFIIEILVVRHYAAAVVFITPLTIFLAEAGSGGSLTKETATMLVQSRFWDTFLGCIFGLLSGLCLHFSGLRDGLARVVLRIYLRGRRL
ncbi:FUSC family protein [Neisseria perflava]|uniref:FUSC family protein n=1 Tax=Neisseria perflava TaxID=33053 RepID=UPI00209FFA34|nr:FUSC family protein [Neisseria perflava]MCP1660648.1 putative membrane protein YccC [Neisseria perflava]